MILLSFCALGAGMSSRGRWVLDTLSDPETSLFLAQEPHGGHEASLFIAQEPLSGPEASPGHLFSFIYN